MSYTIVGIHGLANKPPQVVLDVWWRAAISEGLRRNCARTGGDIKFESVFWADVGHDPLQDADSMKEPYVAFPEDQPLKTYEENWWDEVVAGVIGAGGSALDAAKRYLGLGDIAEKVLEAKLNDLHTYYTDKNRRDELRGRLTEKLKTLEGERVMLIAHSMGSIIAYDVLRLIGQDNPNYRLDHFVTIGSPLGLPHVKDKIYQENDKVRTPTVVEKWTNFADRRDPVALDARLAGDYAPNDRNVEVRDDLIINGYKGLGGDSNYHKSYGYLRAPEVSQLIRSFI